jgi:anti-sigma factor NepR-like protein
MSDGNQRKPAPALGPYVMRTIGRELQALYANIIAEGLPERFAEIVRKLDEPGNEEETR